ncbi:MAG: GtrA family protein [Bacteroidetes bacterium]|nr:MAG: GtrA family protein [Bacteroidota bacterium]
MTVLKGIQKAINGVLDFFYPPFKSILPKETYRYAATGGGNLVLDILLYFVFFHFVLDEQNLNLGFIVISPHIAAFLMVFPITFSTGFLLAKYITFTQSRLRGKKQLMRYGLTVLGSIILNYILLKFFVETMGIYPTPSKILTTFISIIYSFIAQKYFTFKTGKSQLQAK